MASEEKSMLKQLGERHEKLKHKIHTTKIPIKSKWGRSAMGMLYATITFGVCWGLTRSMRVEERGYDVEGSAKRLGLDMEAVRSHEILTTDSLLCEFNLGSKAPYTKKRQFRMCI
mmetsp:Transcript_20543/g.83364  ORF Transcript_20543/g.83364 Transcript_20543/m.83364 type:complete len:115 (-) Transcript_20543:745-1089(-)